jgi:hypothetical protein
MKIIKDLPRLGVTRKIPFNAVERFFEPRIDFGLLVDRLAYDRFLDYSAQHPIISSLSDGPPLGGCSLELTSGPLAILCGYPIRHHKDR